VPAPAVRKSATVNIVFLPEDESEGLPIDDKSLEILMIDRGLSKPEMLYELCDLAA
jgi:hypothetical protein